ncbi:TonB-dependent copper receptor [Marinomonas hwangdonensis]|uniref:TonB-dependent copper receptor n=1 Tax=Marinomonas hwangdonensis TaxID=1053647 RepID=A0A3M8Q9E2_9GAMM|nr:TonB-dependent copper receptor [Marinomonas hwangdonensis]RNF52698.1 TonB-dependent copper receptor [Marinomonas hwangdonensis]
MSKKTYGAVSRSKPQSSNYLLTPVAVSVVLFSQALYSSVAQADNADTRVYKTNAIVISAPALDEPNRTNINLSETAAIDSATDGAAALKQIPGFSAVGNGGVNGDPTFRGMFGSRLVILTDGAQMLGACPNRMDNPTSYINPTAYDEVEIIKGPQTVLWGPGNSAATVRFERKDEDFSEKSSRFEASAMVGSNNRFDRSIEGAVGNSKGYVRLEANKGESDDYEDGNGDNVESSWEKWNTSVAFGLTPDEDTLLELELGRGDGFAEYAGRMMDGTQFLRETVALRFEKDNISENWSKIEAQLNYGYADHIMDNTTFRDGSMVSQVDRRTTSGRIASTWDWDVKSLVTGVDLRQETHRNKGIEDYSLKQAGIFSELTFFLENDDRIVSGLRLDRYSVTDESTINRSSGDTRTGTLISGFTRLEKDFSTMPATSYVGLGYTERFPDYWEMKPGLSTIDSGTAFNDVDHEKTLQLDVGLNYKRDDLSWWVSGYAGIVKDYIIFGYTSTKMMMGTKITGRASNRDAHIAGTETGARYQVTENVSTNASIAYAWGRDLDNNAPLPQISPFEAKLGLTHEKEAWTSNVVLRMVAAQNRVSENMGNAVGYDFGESAGFTTMDINTEFRLSEQIKLRAGVDNVTDKAYAEHLNKAGNTGLGYAAGEAFNQAGRIIWAGVNVKF